MIELAAKLWKLTITATIARLRREGLYQLPTDKAEIKQYVSEHLDARERIRRLWEHAQGRKFLESPTVTRLASKFRINKVESLSRWIAGPGKIVGASDCHTTEFALVPGGKADRHSRNKPGMMIIFKATITARAATKWDDVMLIPFYDLPGRPQAFLCIGRQGRPDKDFIFKVLPASNTGWTNEERQTQQEGGLAMHPDVFDNCRAWKDRVLVMADPLQMLRMQTRNAELYPDPLPIIAWQQNDKSRPRFAWKMFDRQELVFWAPFCEPDILLHAIQNDGLVIVRGPGENTPEAIHNYFRNRVIPDPRKHVEKVMEAAQPWPEVLADHFSTRSDAEVESYLLELELDGIDLNKIIDRSPAELQARMKHLVAKETITRTCQMDNKTIVERKGAWVVDGRRPEVLMNAQLRIDAIIHREVSEETFYKGRVLFEGAVFDFCVPIRRLRKEPFHFLENLVAKKGALIYNSSWASKLVSIALQFQTPKASKGVERIGWDAEIPGFSLPGFCIESTGKVVKYDPFVPKGSPATKLPAPEVLSGQDLDALLSANPTTTAVTLATLTGIVANIVSVVHNEATVGIGVCGLGAVDVSREVARAAGCIVRRLSINGQTDITKIYDAENAHGWPLCIATSNETGNAYQDWLDPTRIFQGQHNCITNMSWYQGMVRRLFRGWAIIEDPEPAIGLTQEAVSSIARFIPAYLQDLCSRNLELNCDDGPWTERVLEDIQNYVSRHYGTMERWGCVNAVMTHEGAGNAGTFADIVSQLVRDGRIEFLPEGFETTRRPAVVCYPGSNRLAVPKKGLADALAKCGARLNDYARITSLLMQDGALQEDQAAYWMVELDWWKSRHDGGNTSQSLRVVS